MTYAEFNSNLRRWCRAAVRLPAQYFIKGQSIRYMDCTILNISRNGAGVLFPDNEPLDAKSPIFIELKVPNTSEQMNIRGVVKNKSKRNDGCVGGIEFAFLLPEDMIARLT
jgi:hypothetical protein